jgi:hypothetical protein
MEAGREYMRDWVGYWGYLSEQVMERCTKASDRIRQEKYGLSNMFSDVVGFWTDTAMASLQLWRGPVRTPQTVIFLLDVQDEFAGPKCVPMFLPALPAEKPSHVWLGCVDRVEGADGNEITWEHVDVRPTADKSGIEVRLLDLPKPLLPATYRCIVRLGEMPVAEIMIVVQQQKRYTEKAQHLGTKPPKPKARPGRSAKKS